MRLNPIMLALAALALGGAAHAAEQLETIEVKDLRQKLQQAGMLKDEIQQTEVISARDIERKQAGSVNEAINNEPGVTVSNECSMCGVKRVMINGLKGEHTTVLVDGVPTHTMASGFYGLDGVATSGVERVEIARGAGASLIAPESVGGTINIVTKRPTENGAEIDLSAGENGYRKYGLSATGVTQDGKTRGLLSAQYDNRDQEDHDGNGVNESPAMENYSVSGKVSHDLTAKDNIELRVLSGSSEVFGGPMLGDTTQGVTEALTNFGGTPTFQDDDVRKRYTGLPGDTTEYIKTDRQELVGKWLHEFGSQTNVGVTLMHSKSEQDSFYEGIDYVAEDDTNFADVRVNHFLNAEHLLTVGVDTRQEELRSRSRTMEAFVTDGDPDTNYVSDSYDYSLTGLYLQDTWTPTSSLEIAAAVRLDKVEADFVDTSKPGTEIDETMVAPRLHVRYDHDKQWTSRLQVGRGYRAPLSFFESDHGILDAGKGFQVDVDELEKSTSASYALSFDNQRLTSTASVAWNQIENLAALAEDANGVPTLSQLDGKARVVSADLVLGYQLTNHWTAGIGLETFQYNDIFKESFAIAPVEERIRLTADYEGHGWNWNTTLTWIGSRDLTDYGYEGFNIAGDPGSVKTTKAPSFYTVDMKLSKELNKTFTAYLGVNNLFDYTQAGDEDTPLFYDADGAYDVGYIYGPLRGRTVYAGVKARF
ncbi:MAG TPA: TonB-dependent receptor [Chromatiales bacterium]|nr:TonB-dependent receptor [Chromatiales bacterium]